jgi:hypothetical protein
VNALAAYLGPLINGSSPSSGQPAVAESPAATPGIAPEEAAELLSRLTDLSNDDVETLLARMTLGEERL